MTQRVFAGLENLFLIQFFLRKLTRWSEKQKQKVTQEWDNKGELLILTADRLRCLTNSNSIIWWTLGFSLSLL